MGKGYDDWLASGKPWVKTYTGGKPNYTVPESPRAAVTRYCDQCQHFDPEKIRTGPVCKLGHYPRFYALVTLSQAERGNWGWKRKCADYQSDTNPIPSQGMEPL